MEVDQKCISAADIDNRLTQYYNADERKRNVVDFNQLYGSVFVNRNVSLEKIRYFGFDMDYTLAVYKSPIYEELGYNILTKRLVSIGYPKELITNYKYDPTFPVRGLFFDTLYGNLLKVDAHGNIMTCIHGFHVYSSHKIREFYPNKYVLPGEKRFFILNTLFNLPEIYVLAAIIDLFHKIPEYQKKPTGVESKYLRLSYKSIHQDVRESVDWMHNKGILKQITAENPEKYVEMQPHLPVLLNRMRECGRKTFLITNSEYWYTESIMNFLFDTANADKPWKNYFDYIVVDAKKPIFFEEGTAMRCVNETTGALQVGSVTSAAFEKRHTYAGGSSEVFMKMVGAKGKDILYLGDHIFGDILKSKRSCGWRTFLVVPEIDREMLVWSQKNDIYLKMKGLERVLEDVYSDYDSAKNPPDITCLRKYLANTVETMDRAYGKLGSLFRSGARQTFYASQAMRFADLYASSFINIINYSLHFLFRAPHQLMPHESAVLDPTVAGFSESSQATGHKFVSAPSTGRDFFCRESNSFSVPLSDSKGVVECEDEDDSTSENNSDSENPSLENLNESTAADNGKDEASGSNIYY
ncbi:Cytosolic purine 5'-nucleotidase [Trichoplax sp. H2]|uniref:Cytosolic purine 5'-nucleotidase n=1 Tax=Trichoplax adhaerens TaxID=10228 RepID=B3SB65_TRIAD|nr:hypothetical protein TRIADDRAFT_64353 [Trichoplax adhaerens]EDV20109.1 hypothetical protein TRIADDRAFT_64353 [Trichoplax adhaerens]RDD45510.1 Cytosolic purine 5'-nucleotidase [Trichoplax sp. H2]|eukprot:XP_002117493.1 hypothetical protein TRIADDRAFT_64353 [Trichoplax adhaerens]